MLIVNKTHFMNFYVSTSLLCKVKYYPGHRNYPLKNGDTLCRKLLLTSYKLLIRQRSLWGYHEEPI